MYSPTSVAHTICQCGSQGVWVYASRSIASSRIVYCSPRQGTRALAQPKLQGLAPRSCGTQAFRLLTTARPEGTCATEAAGVWLRGAVGLKPFGCSPRQGPRALAQPKLQAGKRGAGSAVRAVSAVTGGKSGKKGKSGAGNG
jgi:hypothetical protein